MKKNPFSLHVDLGDFLPATEEEKAYMVQMRPSTTFFKDGMKRLFKNKIATLSMIIIVLVTLAALLLPAVWPYGYAKMLGNTPGKPMDASYNNLAPFHYGSTERGKLLGQANIQAYFFPAEVPTVRESMKAEAEALLAAYQAGTPGSEAFAALETVSGEYDQREAVKPSYYKGEEQVQDWVWEVTASGKGVRASGDVQLIEE